ncbi:MAG TPA: hypothetical protein VGV37_18700 [Aliidongia sp.]|uniref:hypothetical protein n=1 Tax=Aliidongia sp. TaxID=1914230 RepID=UPI002DDCF42A|nr:hypothetical protein [Aliidongia sp.]HEV2676563.1 hypothetical protein [Aliidongia sp.]
MNRFSYLLAACGLGLALGGPVAAARADGPACDLDHAPSSRWTVTRDHGIAWLATPCGERFFSTGVNVLDGGAPERVANDRVWYSWTAFAPSLAAWVDEATSRVKSWGFNSAGGWSLPPDQLKLPQIPDLELGRLGRFHWFDPFDPATEQAMRDEAVTLVRPYKDSPYRIGYFSDNEVGWWNGALFVFYSKAPATNFTKQRWVAFLQDFYGSDWQRFAADFQPPAEATDWPRLLATQSVTRLRPGGNGIQAVRAWTGVVAEHYYALVERSIRAADPQALIFGDRLPIYYDPVAIRAEARHVDVIATNYNVDSPDGWVARYFFDGLHQLTDGKPVLVSEWFYAANENRTGNKNNGHLMTVETQAERAQGAATAIRQFARIPDLVGMHWFQYADHPKGGRADGEDYDFGLVDIDNRPYERLLTAVSAVNGQVPALHAAAGTDISRQTDRKEISIPYAEVMVGDKTLADWPKQATLLPPLVAAPGEVPFGEAYLAWNRDGLALATIGQDYYDLDLLAYDGAFPLAEAYRVELGVDAGNGVKHFTLYFLPPRTSLKDHPPMTALLCAGIAAVPADPAPQCRPVTGARTSYFGADQPRITSESLLPWGALGLDGPPAGGQMRVEVSATAWHRSRWMSLSGMPPEQGWARPKRWSVARLGRVS